MQTGDLRGALTQLEQAMQLSQQLQDFSHDADVWGEMADTYADIGDYEKAAQVGFSLSQAIISAPQIIRLQMVNSRSRKGLGLSRPPPPGWGLSCDRATNSASWTRTFRKSRSGYTFV